MHVQIFEPETEARIAKGKTRREAAEQFGFEDKSVVKNLLKRQLAYLRVPPNASVIGAARYTPQSQNCAEDYKEAWIAVWNPAERAVDANGTAGT